MPTFLYEALDEAGVELHDSIDATNEAEAITRLREKGRYVTRIVESETGTEAVSAAKAKRRIRRAFNRGQLIAYWSFRMISEIHIGNFWVKEDRNEE